MFEAKLFQSIEPLAFLKASRLQWFRAFWVLGLGFRAFGILGFRVLGFRAVRV